MVLDNVSRDAAVGAVGCDPSIPADVDVNTDEESGNDDEGNVPPGLCRWLLLLLLRSEELLDRSTTKWRPPICVPERINAVSM